MNVDFIGLWHSLERLPLLFSLAVYALVLLTFACFFIMPMWLVIRSEPPQILRTIRNEYTLVALQSGWRGVLRRISFCLSMFNTVVGRLAAWLVLFMTLMQFVVVIMRYVFSYGSIQMQESIWYMHGLLFMLGAAYTLTKEGHVRLDVFYREASERTKAWINLCGALIFLLPFCIANFDFAWSLVLNSWAVREGSTETAGLPYIYLFKTVILIFSVLVAMEGVSLGIKSILTLSEKPAPKGELKGA